MKTNRIAARAVTTPGRRISSLTRMIMLCLLFVCAGSLRAQDALQFNVPYACNDGATYVVHKCVAGPKGELCFYQAEGESERFNKREAVEYQMTKMCKLKSAASPGAPNAQSSSELQLNTPYQCAGNLSLTIFQCEKQNGQDYCQVRVKDNDKFLMQVPKPRSEILTQLKACTVGASVNPPYLAEFPAASDVAQGMVTGNPKDNIIRAIGALYQVTEILNVLSTPRGTAGYTPDEKKLLDSYSKLQSALVQGASKILPGQQFNVATNPYHFSRSDPKFGFEGIPVWTTFFSPNMQARFAQIVGANDSRYMAAIELQRRAAMQQVQANAAKGGSPFIRNDPGTLAARRCIELGGNELKCMENVFWTGLTDLGGGAITDMLHPAGSHFAGVVMNGSYQGSAEPRFSFGAESVLLNGCGRLVSDNHAYTVTKKPNQLLINVQSQPTPIVLSMGGDGRLLGPGPIDVKGEIIVGHRDVYESPVTGGSGVGHWSSVPILGPKTERCTIGTLAQVPPPPPDKNPLAGVVREIAASMSNVVTLGPPGLRMSGQYVGQGGFALDFADDAVTLDCGEAHVKQPYTVENAATQFLITVNNGSTPFTLALQPNGTLSGSGSADVAGRVVTGATQNAATYVPKNARCAIGTLTPKQ